jgi:hypothetical protein
VGKPVVIEETYALNCSTEQWFSFMNESRNIATGWVGHYLFPYPVEELKNRQNKTMGEAIYQGWLTTFIEMKPQFAPDLMPAKHNN